MNVLWKMPTCSSGRFDDRLRQLDRRVVEISIHDGEQPAERLVFGGVESFRVTYHHACTLDMIKAYDRVIELPETPWLAEIRQQLLKAGDSANGLRHLRMYLDDGPCYEFVCRTFSAEAFDHDVTET